MTTALSVWLVAVLVAAAGLKAWQPEQAAAALATYGIDRERLQRGVLLLLVAGELTLAVALTAGADWAAGAVAGLFLAFSGVALAALLAGRRGRPCACFGAASRLGWWSPISSFALALIALLVALGWLPDAATSYDRWLTAGLSLSLMAVLLLGLAVLALAREVGVLRLGAIGPGALEILDEGPQLGVAQPWAGAVDASPRALLLVAIFSSPNCPVCRQAAPAADHVSRDPLLAVRVFDEELDAAVFRQADVPGSPYAVALDLDGIAIAKGTFNNLPQLESILASARARELGVAVVA
jgi:hypothetical protein